VNFSTSSSKVGSGLRKGHRELACVLVCASVFTLLTACWLLAPRSISLRFRALAPSISPPLSPDWYLAYFNGDVEHFAIYNDLGGAAESLKRADVLFVGNSRIQYAFRDRATLRDFFSARNMTYFVLAFGYNEGEIFPEAIIRKFDLHPKWVIVNANPFFGTQASVPATQAMSLGYWEAWKTSFEAVSSLAVQRRIHRIFPYFGLSQWDKNQVQYVAYRSRSDGTVLSVEARGTPEPVRPGDGFSGPLPTEDQIKEAKEFKKDLDARGAKLILTWIPPGSGNTARTLASLLHVPFVPPEETGLSTYDGRHLDYKSGRRLSASFLSAFGKVIEQTENHGQQ
jgi:hypothetical protein